MKRLLTSAVLALTLAGCGAGTSTGTSAGTSADDETASTGTSSAPGSPGAPAGTTGAAVDTAAQARFAHLEERFDARLGLFALDTGSGRTVEHRTDERFAFASTYKALAAAAVLDRTTDAELDAVVTWGAGDLVEHSPVTEDHVGTGLPLREVAQAAITVSDNTAANLLLEHLGGPQALEADLRALGDSATEVENGEPEVNDHAPGEVQDTSTPRAMATSLQATRSARRWRPVNANSSCSGCRPTPPATSRSAPACPSTGSSATRPGTRGCTATRTTSR